jgi:hypothetical protein
MRHFQEREAVVRRFRKKFGRLPDLRNPTTFNEKIAYKILYDRRPILTRLQDKLQARDHVTQEIGAEYLTELYQVCESPREIDWQRLPQRFVIKMNHGSGMNVFVVDKSRINVSSIVARLDRWRAANYYRVAMEWAYRDIRPMIFIEEMLGEEFAVDWKFLTFDGRAEFLHIYRRELSGNAMRTSYDRHLNRLAFRGRNPNWSTEPVFPHNIDLMFSLADKLSGGLDFLRVDMFNIDGRILFTEFTNYHGAGLLPFNPPEFDEIYGSKWRWPPDYGPSAPGQGATDSEMSQLGAE